jgi:site-specific DNA recombinase
MRKAAPEKSPPPRRCAIYTRKSTTNGLEQEFNSLDAQREACEAYAKSQGWTLVDQRYDDGGFTGANFERPAFQRLLADVEAKRVDVVIVYKVDRLSRSLLDFAKVMDRFNQAGVAFVSVTQNFSTADAMGRLTLNIVMSFAEFEREMIAERTRDKIHAARRKGKWTGGPIPYGYDVLTRKLVVNKLEAVVVREIYDGYLRHRSPIRVIEDLRAKGRVPKRYVTKAGTVGGAGAWNVTTVLRILKNPLYIGRVTIGRETYDGEHEAIVDVEKFEQVRTALGAKAPVMTKSVQRGYILRGVLRCGVCGSAMTPASAYKGEREYRYYRCTKRDREGRSACPTRPLSAQAVEAFVVERLRKIAADEKLVSRVTSAIEARITAMQDKLERERRELPPEVGRLSSETKSLVSSLAEMTEAGRKAVSMRLDQVAQAMALAQERLGAVEARLEQLGRVRVEAAWTAKTLAALDRLWETLNEDNRARLVRCLVERVVVNEGANALRIELIDHTSEIDDAA